MGLRNVFAASVTSREIGETMPRPGCYRAALERLGISAGDAAFIASQPQSLDGAARIGLQTIAFNSLPSPPPSAAATVERFSELCRVVQPAALRDRAG